MVRVSFWQLLKVKVLSSNLTSFVYLRAQRSNICIKEKRFLKSLNFHLLKVLKAHAILYTSFIKSAHELSLPRRKMRPHLSQLKSLIELREVAFSSVGHFAGCRAGSTVKRSRQHTASQSAPPIRLPAPPPENASLI